jgi:hypothetical protein
MGNEKYIFGADYMGDLRKLEVNIKVDLKEVGFGGVQGYIQKFLD